MKKFNIKMPDNVRYMSDAHEVLNQYLPQTGKYILDKSLTGCGGTEFFINSGRSLVLVSPRTGVLINKSQQHPECHLFRDTTKVDIKKLKDNLRKYLNRPRNVFGPSDPDIILVTLDSAKYVIEELKYRGKIDNYLFLNDEFQCLVSDAAFKGDVDLEFLRMLNAEAKNICYMSATPIDDTYLNALPEFQDVDYFKLQWDPNVVVEPTIKEVMMKPQESTVSIFSNIIAYYRRNGYFARKGLDGVTVEAKEVVVFVNEVKTILDIIKKNKLKPQEVTILVSASNKYVTDLNCLGFSIEGQQTNRSKPVNTTYTFCSKASFEGRDFYSTSAFTYIFIDGTKDWEVHDTAIEIPQMLGRQRLDANPFKYNAVIYYRTSPKVGNDNYMQEIAGKLENSQAIVDNYFSGDDRVKRALSSMVKDKNRNNRYASNYLDIINDADGGFSLAINLLVAAAEHNLAVNKAYFYSNPLFLTTAIHNQMATYNAKSQELRDFEKQFNNAQTFSEQLRIYSQFRSVYPEYYDVLRSNPFIEERFHAYFNRLGAAELSQLNYDENGVHWEYCQHEIALLCQSRFSSGNLYTNAEIKQGLQQIYDSLNLGIAAKAKQIAQYLNVSEVQQTQPDGSRPRLIRIN